MPPADIEITEAVVRELLAQFAVHHPAAAAGQVRTAGVGWDNACFQFGQDLLVRVPRRLVAAPLLLNEVRWLPELAPRLPIAVPEAVFVGEPTESVPWPWAVCRWVPGALVADLPLGERGDLVEGMAAAFLALHEPAGAHAPRNPFRGIPLASRPAVRERILAEKNGIRIPVEFWDRALAAPEYAGPPLWVHGDPHSLNLVQQTGRLSGMIDFGDLCAGDPASDLAMAWAVFDAPDRDRLRSVLDAAGRYDDAICTRAAGWAASFASAMEPDTPLWPVALQIVAQLRADD